MINKTIIASIIITLPYLTSGIEETRINVKSYITKKADQTKAIKDAVAAAKKKHIPTLFFPAGTYQINEVIDISGLREIIGQGYPEIRQKNKDKDIFYSYNAWRMTIKGLRFLGGRNQIAIGNKNTDQGFLVISDCRFRDASGSAIRFIRNKSWDTASTFALVEKCAFRNCLQTLIAVSDQTHLRDCWITTTNEKSNKAVIENYGVLTCQNILGVPHVTSNDQRWIDNHNTLSVKKFRFGGEGAGFTPVVNFAKRKEALAGPRITITDSSICALGNNKRACAVYCEEIPNQIVIRDSVLSGVPAVLVDKKIDLATYFNNVRPGMLLYKIEDNIGEFAGTLPQAMLTAAAKRKITKIKYGNRQLSETETAKALKVARAQALAIPHNASPGSMKLNNGTRHNQQTLKGSFIDITPETHHWDLTDNLDGITENVSDYLAIAHANSDTIIMQRMDNASYPHIRIRNVQVDLDKTPILSWRTKNNNILAGHLALKIVNNEDQSMTLLMENYQKLFGYWAYDLRDALKMKSGKVNIDIKLYLCGSFVLDALNIRKNKKGEFVVLDFIRLEKD